MAGCSDSPRIVRFPGVVNRWSLSYTCARKVPDMPSKPTWIQRGNPSVATIREGAEPLALELSGKDERPETKAPKKRFHCPVRTAMRVSPVNKQTMEDRRCRTRAMLLGRNPPTCPWQFLSQLGGRFSASTKSRPDLFPHRRGSRGC